MLEVIYLIFNEGFHSASRERVVREELCGEAMRMCQLLLDAESMRPHAPTLSALAALMCFHAARLHTKVDRHGQLIDLTKQDRSAWDIRLIYRANELMQTAVTAAEFSAYHYEAAIASEHLRASTFESTNWTQIAVWYERLRAIAPSPMTDLSLAIVYIHNGNPVKSGELLGRLPPRALADRGYLLYGAWAEWHKRFGTLADTRAALQKAIGVVVNRSEKDYLQAKLDRLTERMNSA